MNSCCQDISKLSCSVVDILKRIQPIQYTSDDILLLDSPVSVEDAMSVGGAEVSIVGNHINLPARTLINGVPLLSDAFTNDILSLPLTTKINGYYPITEQYYYYFNAQEGSFSYKGYIVNGRTYPVNVRTATQDPHGFSFIVPENCVLTSLKLLYVMKPGIFATPTDATIFIDVVDTNLNPYYTGVFLTIPKPASNSRTFVETQFEYYVQKGDSVAVWVQGDAQFLGSITPFAILGFRVLPTGTPLPSTQPSSLYASEPYPTSGPFFNMLYGVSMRASDYNTRLLSAAENRSSAYQDGFAYFFSNQKTEGTFVDISESFRNTQTLETDYQWKGVLVGPTSADRILSIQVSPNALSPDLLTQYEMPTHIDFLSFDLKDVFPAFDTLIPVLSHFQFGFATIRHNDDPNVRMETRDSMLVHGYTRVFTDVLMVSDKNGWTAMEDWYAHPDIADAILIQKIVEHPDNKENIHFTACAEILKNISEN